VSDDYQRLDNGGYISKIREGRGTRYLVDLQRPLRHKTQRDVAVKRLMAILNVKGSKTDALRVDEQSMLLSG
jgi:hypothetical protein